MAKKNKKEESLEKEDKNTSESKVVKLSKKPSGENLVVLQESSPEATTTATSINKSKKSSKVVKASEISTDKKLSSENLVVLQESSPEATATTTTTSKSKKSSKVVKASEIPTAKKPSGENLVVLQESSPEATTTTTARTTSKSKKSSKVVKASEISTAKKPSGENLVGLQESSPEATATARTTSKSKKSSKVVKAPEIPTAKKPISENLVGLQESSPEATTTTTATATNKSKKSSKVVKASEISTAKKPISAKPVVEKKSESKTSASEPKETSAKTTSARVEVSTSESSSTLQVEDTSVIDVSLPQKSKTNTPEEVKKVLGETKETTQKTKTKKIHTRNERRKKALLKKNTNSESNYNYNRAYSSDDNFNLLPPAIPPQKPIPFVDLSKVNTVQKPQKPQNSKKNEVVPVNSEKLLTSEERKDPFFQNFFRDVEKFVLKEMLIERGAKVLLGVSGGVDSVVLLDVLAILADKYDFNLYVAHYNHNLRGKSSNEDEQFVKKLAASYNLPYYWASGKVQQYSEKNNLSIEESARLLRYLFFERTARTTNVDFLATAHTADDSVETFLLNLFRGTGLTGLSGIPSRRQFIKDVILFRPFIGIKKKKIIEYAEKRKLKWREDDTNLLDKYTRNKIRIDLLPKLQKEYNPSIVDVINRASKLIHSADKIIHDYVRTHIGLLLADVSTDRVYIKLPIFRTFDEFIRGEMLQMVLMKYFKMQSISMNTVDRILRLENSEIGAMCEISKTIFAIRDRQLLIIAKKTVPIKINQKIEKTGKFTIGSLIFVLKEISLDEVEYNKNPNVEYFDFNLIPNILTIRNWEQGDEFSPLGMKGKMKISDFLSNEKVAILDKPNVLVLSTGSGDILWVCKKRINEKFKITDKTKRILKIEIKNIL